MGISNKYQDTCGQSLLQQHLGINELIVRFLDVARKDIYSIGKTILEL